jgi:threonine aldolase
MGSFASDNHSPAHPAVLEAIALANVGDAPAYGADEWSARATSLLCEQLGADGGAFLVTNGTGANVLALRASCRPWESVICAASSHLNTDECGAPERIAGVKLIVAATEDGKLTSADVERALARLGGEHHGEARLVSISQSTELGTCYSAAELRALVEHAHDSGLLVHLDGARLCCAAASLGVPLRELAGDAGVDVITFGGTKLGLLGVEAVVFRDPALADGFAYLRKQSLQLASKGRYLGAQMIALLGADRWHAWATHANAMARRLAERVGEIDGVRITRPVQANVVFASLPASAIETLARDWTFYVWDAARDEVRWMCSWNTAPQDVERFADAIAAAIAEVA